MYLEGGGFEVAVARGGWKSKGESITALFEYYMCTTSSVSIAGRILSGYPNPRVGCFPPTFSAFVTSENKDQVMRMMSDLLDSRFMISTCPSLSMFAKTMMSSLLQYHEELIILYGSKHLIVRAVSESAQKFGITSSRLSEWGRLIREDFAMRNGGRCQPSSAAGDFNMVCNFCLICNKPHALYLKLHCI